MTMRITVGDPAELFAALCCLIGFQPVDGIVVYAVSGAGNLAGAVFLDGADCPATQNVARWRELAARTATRLTAMGHDALGVETVGIVVFTGDGEEKGASLPMASERMTRGVECLRHGLGFAVAADACWMVSADRFRHLTCADSCCPPDGRQRQPAEGVTSAFAEAGYPCASTRTTWLAIAAPPRADRVSARRAALRWRRRRAIASDGARFRPGLIPAALLAWREDGLALWRAALSVVDGGRCATAPDLGRLAESLADTVVRDAMILDLLDDGALASRSLSGQCDPEVRMLVGHVFERPDMAPGPRAVRAADVLCSVAAHAAPGQRAPALGVLAWLSWWRADHHRAVEYAREALADIPGHPLARLVCGLVETNMSPAWARAEVADPMAERGLAVPAMTPAIAMRG